MISKQREFSEIISWQPINSVNYLKRAVVTKLGTKLLLLQYKQDSWKVLHDLGISYIINEQFLAQFHLQ